MAGKNLIFKCGYKKVHLREVTFQYFISPTLVVSPSERGHTNNA